MSEFAMAHPYLTFFGFIFAVYCVVDGLFRSWNRFVRHLNVKKHGWPPEYCDADGDLKDIVIESKRIEAQESKDFHAR